METSFFPGLDVNEASYYLIKHGFPPEKWKDLANGLKRAGATGTIEANNPDVSARLQALIRDWLANDKEPKWQTLVNAVRMCKETVIADKLAQDVGASYSGTTLITTNTYIA